MAATASGKDKIMKYTRMIVGGYDLSGDSRNVNSAENALGEADVTGWNEEVRNYLSSGVRDVAIRGYQALLNDAAGRAYAILKDADNATQVSLLFGGGGEPTQPDPAYLLDAVQMSDRGMWLNQVGALEVDFVPTGSENGYPWGVVLANDTLSSGAEFTPASHDNEGSTSDGGHANLHVITAGGTGRTIRIEHSTDDSSWSTLGTFSSDGTSIGSEHLEIAAGTTVNQYVRAYATSVADTPEIVITFARN